VTSSDGRGPFAILGVNHLGLAPKDAEKARWFFTVALALPALGDELVHEQQVHTVMIGSSRSGTTAAARLEILVPTPSGAGAVGKFLEKKGSGIHHVALTVTGLVPLLAHLQSLGVRLIDAAPRPGAHRTRIAFVHPESTGGLLVELVEETT
jgi:methylmalonyl-CoA/ethylmalonyl-CoA epimerase